MIFRQLFDSASSTYTYLLGDEETRKAILIDSVFEQHARDAALIRELDLELAYAVETHVHADHVTGAWLMKQTFPGAQIVISQASGAKGADRYVREGDGIEFGRRAIRVRATPGHTDGCVTYVADDERTAFTGDTLMIRGAGRTDFQQGSAKRMFHSIRERIFTLPDHCLLYPAHDYSGRTVTSVAEERRHNPRVGGEADENDFVGYMDNLNLPHPKKLAIAVPANMVVGEPEDGQVPKLADWAPVYRTYAGVLEVEPEWVSHHLGEVHVLDVREPHENESLPGIAGAQWISIGDLANRVGEVPTDKPIVTVCRSGRRSAQAFNVLRKAGVERVANMHGGMLRWTALSPDKDGPQATFPEA
jgi:sulfur dioxygenase